MYVIHPETVIKIDTTLKGSVVLRLHSLPPSLLPPARQSHRLAPLLRLRLLTSQRVLLHHQLLARIQRCLLSLPDLQTCVPALRWPLATVIVARIHFLVLAGPFFLGFATEVGSLVLLLGEGVGALPTWGEVDALGGGGASGVAQRVGLGLVVFVLLVLSFEVVEDPLLVLGMPVWRGEGIGVGVGGGAFGEDVDEVGDCFCLQLLDPPSAFEEGFSELEVGLGGPGRLQLVLEDGPPGPFLLVAEAHSNSIIKEGGDCPC